MLWYFSWFRCQNSIRCCILDDKIRKFANLDVLEAFCMQRIYQTFESKQNIWNNWSNKKNSPTFSLNRWYSKSTDSIINCLEFFEPQIDDICIDCIEYLDKHVFLTKFARISIDVALLCLYKCRWFYPHSCDEWKFYRTRLLSSNWNRFLYKLFLLKFSHWIIFSSMRTIPYSNVNILSLFFVGIPFFPLFCRIFCRSSPLSNPIHLSQVTTLNWNVQSPSTRKMYFSLICRSPRA